MPIKSGLHSPNIQYTEEDYSIIEAMAPDSVEIFCNQYTQHRADVVGRLSMLGAKHFCVRLHNTQEPDGHIMSAEDFAHRLFAEIHYYYAFGIRWFRVCNEPNWMFTRPGFGPYDYVYFMKRAITRLRALLLMADLTGVKLISPPLSYSPALWHPAADVSVYSLDEWRKAFREPVSSSEAIDQHTLYSFFDLAGATVYWQYAHQMFDPSYAMCYKAVAGDSRLPVVAVEYACSLHDVVDKDGNRVYNSHQVEDIRIAQYPQWVFYANSFGVEAAYGYMVGGTPEWTGFRWTRTLAQTMSRSKKHAGGGSKDRLPL